MQTLWGWRGEARLLERCVDVVGLEEIVQRSGYGGKDVVGLEDRETERELQRTALELENKVRRTLWGWRPRECCGVEGARPAG